MAWRPRILHHEIHPALRGWLTHTASLTAKLREHYPGLRVRLVRQANAHANPDECAALGLATQECAWIREVVLHVDGLPLVFAHSVLPRQNLRGAWPLFGGLGNRPLGEVLFTDPAIARGPLQFNAITPRHPFHRMAQAACPDLPLPASLWARRSLFARHGKNLLVSEVFLPTLITPKA